MKPVDFAPLLTARGLTLAHAPGRGCFDVDLSLYPGEVLAIAGESGSGKSTLLNCLAGLARPDAGSVRYASMESGEVDIHAIPEALRRRLARTEWGYVHQNAALALRMDVSAGANVGARLMALGARHYGDIRARAVEWLERVEIDPARVDDLPRTFSGGMQQRLQIVANMVTNPRLLFLDEPTSGLDVSVQARLLDLLKRLAEDMGLACVIVTHDLGVARLLAHRLAVMQNGRIIESGVTDQVLDDPREPYTQLLVSSILPV
jgi:putative phosphonate transport system ATP-binding protein